MLVLPKRQKIAVVEMHGTIGGSVKSPTFERILTGVRTNTRTTCTLIWTAMGVLSTLAAMTAPCSVNARGGYRLLAHLAVAICDRKSVSSCGERRNAKSSGNRTWFRLTCSLSLLVETP